MKTSEVLERVKSVEVQSEGGAGRDTENQESGNGHGAE